MTRLNAEIITRNGINSRMKAFVKDAESCIIIDCDESGITDIWCKSEEAPVLWEKETRGFLGCRIRANFVPDEPSDSQIHNKLRIPPLHYVANVFYNAFLMEPGDKREIIEWLWKWTADFSVFDDLPHPSPEDNWAF